MAQAPIWQEVEITLFEKAKEVIGRIAKEHPNVLCSFFAYAANPIAGTFAICVDTQENAFQQAQKEETRLCQRREEFLSSPSAWRHAEYYLRTPQLTDYNPIIDYFHFAFYGYFTFDGWTEFFDSENYPERRPAEEDYLTGNSECRKHDRGSL